MVAVAHEPYVPPDWDQHVVLRGVTWRDFETCLAIRGDRAGVRMYFLDGEIEFMSPTKDHEGRKKTLARLLEQWAVELDVELHGFGAWTLKNKKLQAAGEPDECYLLGDPERGVPDLVIEVEWSRTTGVDKQELYRRIGVRELWTLTRDGALVVRVLERGAWTFSPKSKLLPKLELAWLVGFLEMPQPKAVRALRDALRAPPKKKR